MSMIGLASSLGLSERRQRRNLDEMRSLREAAWTDPLTGAVNRRAAEMEMKRSLALYRRKGTPVSILVLDVDYFKDINDRWGHHIGDEVLKQITKVVTSTLREMDLVARFGGEEFIAILSDSNIRHAAIASERVRHEVEAAGIVHMNEMIRFTVSIGITAAVDGDDSETIFKRADKALYAAKRAGRNRVFACVNGLPCYDVAEQIES